MKPLIMILVSMVIGILMGVMYACLAAVSSKYSKYEGDDMNRDELSKVLEDHLHWIREDCEGWQNMKADLRGADLRGADLRGADLRGAENVPFIPYACPDFGMFIGFKKAHGYIVVLEIPEDAKRLSATGRKCRCDKAKVLEIQNFDGTKADVTEVRSNYDSDFIYKTGETVTVEDFCENRWDECSEGIHFFINRQEAVDY